MNSHVHLPAGAAAAARTATAKPNHGQFVSAATHQNHGKAHAKKNKGQAGQHAKSGTPEPDETETPGD